MRLDVAQRGNTGGQRGSGNEPPADRTRPVWKRQRAGIFSALRLALSRFARGWQLLLAVALGMVVAVVLICTVPLYDTLVADLQFQQALHSNDATGRNVEAAVQSGWLTPATRAEANQRVNGLASQYLSSFVAPTSTYYAITDPMLLEQVGPHSYDIAATGSPQARFLTFDFAAAAPHLHFIAGGLPSATSATPQVDITEQMAQDEAGAAVGNTIRITQFGDHSVTFTATIAGVFTPTDPNDPYWNGLTFAADANAGEPNTYPLLIQQSTFFSRLPAFTQTPLTQHYIFYTRPETLNTGNISNALDRIGQFRAHISGDVLPLSGIASVRVETLLDQTIQSVQSQAALLALPLYVIVAQIAALALLFVVAMASLLVEAQSPEIATLKSRGASGTQLLGSYATQGLVLALIAAIIGPFLAALLSLALLRWFVPADVFASAGVSPSYFSTNANPSVVIIPAIIGALLGIGAVLFATFQSARLDVLAFRREQARTGKPPLWRRYYLDIALAVLCAIGYLELNQFGGVSTRQQLGGSGASPLLLVTPALLLLAGALIILRVFPLVAGLGGHLAARGRGLTSLLAFAQVERSPSRYTRITLLLVLAVGLGLFALTFDTSLQQNAYDRATYAVGTDVLAQTLTGEGNGAGQKIAASMSTIPGVLGVSPAYRTVANQATGEASANIDLLGIDSATWQQDAGSVSWRNDYADQPLGTLMSGMSAHSGLRSPGTETAPIWALVSDQFAALMHVKPGDRFSLQLSEVPYGTTTFVVGAVIHEFPTLYPTREPGSFIVVNLNDLFGAIKQEAPTQDTSLLGPNEFWLRTTPDANGQAAIVSRLRTDGTLDVSQVNTLATTLSQNNSNPVGSGMRGLLIVGALTAALLAILGSIIQSLLATRRRATQFAVLRTVGMSGRQLTGLLLGEQIVVYVFGLIGGTLLGLLLVTATLPFLQFSDTTIDPSRLGIPPYLLTFNGPGTAIFYASLFIAFVLALAIAARYATTIGLGKALRLGED